MHICKYYFNLATMVEQTNEQYHADTSRISKSGLDLINKSPAHYYAKYLDPNYQREAEDGRHYVIGSITHAAILEPHTLERDFFVLNDTKILQEIGGGNPRGTNRYKEWVATERAFADGKQQVRQDEFDEVRRMRDAVLSHPGAAFLLKSGIAERTITWTDKTTGAPCKCRPDFDSDTGFLVDLKTCEDARRLEFGRKAYGYRYHVQAPFYYDGAAVALGGRKGFIFIAIEKAPPYGVAIYETPADVMELGREQYLENLATYVECLESGEWPSYPVQITGLALPSYAFTKY